MYKQLDYKTKVYKNKSDVLQTLQSLKHTPVALDTEPKFTPHKLEKASEMTLNQIVYVVGVKCILFLLSCI